MKINYSLTPLSLLFALVGSVQTSQGAPSATLIDSPVKSSAPANRNPTRADIEKQIEQAKARAKQARERAAVVGREADSKVAATSREINEQSPDWEGLFASIEASRKKILPLSEKLPASATKQGYDQKIKRWLGEMRGAVAPQIASQADVKTRTIIVKEMRSLHLVATNSRAIEAVLLRIKADLAERKVFLPEVDASLVAIRATLLKSQAAMARMLGNPSDSALDDKLLADSQKQVAETETWLAKNQDFVAQLEKDEANFAKEYQELQERQRKMEATEKALRDSERNLFSAPRKPTPRRPTSPKSPTRQKKTGFNTESQVPFFPNATVCQNYGYPELQKLIEDRQAALEFGRAVLDQLAVAQRQLAIDRQKLKEAVKEVQDLIQAVKADRAEIERLKALINGCTDSATLAQYKAQLANARAKLKLDSAKLEAARVKADAARQVATTQKNTVESMKNSYIQAYNMWVRAANAVTQWKLDHMIYEGELVEELPTKKFF